MNNHGNKSALGVAEELRRLGCKVWSKGWPDLLVMRGTNVFAVEVKLGEDQPSREQVEINELLWRVDIPTFEVRNRLCGSAIDRIIEQKHSQGHTSIIKLEALYEAIKADGARTVPETLFESQGTVQTGFCTQCDCHILIEKSRLA